jgi:threonine dehydrogenase-like Zn-dependent dehydrogenase
LSSLQTLFRVAYEWCKTGLKNSSKITFMQTAVYYSNSDVRIEEKPRPDIGPGELLIKVIAGGICGTDVLEWYRIHRAPLILGHEIAGTIEEVGPGATAYKVGDRVAAAHHVPCNTCHYCLSGHATVCDTLRQTNFDPEAAKRVGANFAWRASENIPARLREINEGRLADLVIICAGAPAAIGQALASVERGGTVLFFAATKDAAKINIPVNDIFWRNEITLTSSYGGDRGDHITALNLIAAGRVKVADLITHRLPLAEIQEGFNLVAEGGDAIKVIIFPPIK